MFGFLKRRKAPRIVAHLKVGKPAVSPDKPTHVSGVREGNNPGQRMVRRQGLIPVDERTSWGTAKRSTGIRPRAHGPIDPRMPNLSPP